MQDDAWSSSREYWDSRYERIGATNVSWYEAQPELSLELLDGLPVGPGSPLIDVGGGASTLVDALLHRGWRDLTVLDIAPAALVPAQERIGSSPVHWVVSDLLRWWPVRRFNVWHDRAVFHFLTMEHQRELYRCRLAAALRPGGYALVATFAPDGPDTCSGLPVARYDEPALAAAIGPHLEMVAHRRQIHFTPKGGQQPFTWIVLRAPSREGESLDDYISAARAELDRVRPGDLAAEVGRGALVIDIRPAEQRLRDGDLPGALIVDRNVLEWRTVVTSPHRLPAVTSADQRIIVVCTQGYASSIAAATLRRLGMPFATDLAGGFQALLRDAPGAQP